MILDLILVFIKCMSLYAVDWVDCEPFANPNCDLDVYEFSNDYLLFVTHILRVLITGETAV